MTTRADGAGAWDARFAAPGYLFGTEPNVFLARNASRIPPGSRVLCVADGEGRNGAHLAALGHRVVTFDVSPVAIGKARTLAAERGVDVERHLSDLDAWDWTPDRFDAVVAVFIQFAPPAMRDRAFAGMLRTLRAGGLLLLHGYTPRQLVYGTGGPPFVEHLYTEELLRAAFADHEIELLAEYDAVVDEGPAHHGRSALIDCIVRKR